MKNKIKSILNNICCDIEKDDILTVVINFFMSVFLGLGIATTNSTIFTDGESAIFVFLVAYFLCSHMIRIKNLGFINLIFVLLPLLAYKTKLMSDILIIFVILYGILRYYSIFFDTNTKNEDQSK